MKKEGDQAENVRQVVEGTVNPVLETAGIGKRVQLSDDQLNELYNRFMRIIREITERERSKKVFNGVLEIIHLIREQTAEVGDTAQEHLQQLQADLKSREHVWNSLQLSKELFENFAGNKSLDGIIDNIRSIFEIIKEDPEVRNYLNDVRNFLVQVLENTDLLTRNETAERGRRLIGRARELQNNKLLGHVNNIGNEVRDLVNRLEQDPLNIKLRQDMQRLVADLALDEQGNFVYKPEVLDQLKLIITKSIVERLRIPIAPIRTEGEDLDYEISGLVVNMRDLMPERVLIESRGKVVLDPKQMEIEGAAHGLRIFMYTSPLSIFFSHSLLPTHHKPFLFFVFVFVFFFFFCYILFILL